MEQLKTLYIETPLGWGKLQAPPSFLTSSMMYKAKTVLDEQGQVLKSVEGREGVMSLPLAVEAETIRSEGVSRLLRDTHFIDKESGWYLGNGFSQIERSIVSQTTGVLLSVRKVYRVTRPPFFCLCANTEVLVRSESLEDLDLKIHELFTAIK